MESSDNAGRSGATPAISYDGKLGEIYPIFLLNILFTILTLGIFRFWAITRMRRYFWSRTSFQGERFTYTGTGGQLFVGFLLAGLILIGLGVAAAVLGFLLSYIWQPLGIVPVALLYPAIIVLALGAVFSAQRYRLSQTIWHGLRGGMTGSMIAYGLRSLAYGLLVIVTLFQMTPWAQLRLAERRIGASRLGHLHFACRAREARIYGVFLVTFLAGLVLFIAIFGLVGLRVWALLSTIQTATTGAGMTPGQTTMLIQQVMLPAYAAIIGYALIGALLRCWYAACLERAVVGHTSLGPVRFSSTLSGGALFRLVFGNLLILIFTIGLGLPIVLHRNARILARTLHVQGYIDPARIAPDPGRPSRYGEGMYQQLDAGGAMV